MLKKILWLVVLISSIAIIAFWLNKEQWLEDFNQQRQQQTALFVQKGTDFSSTADQRQCLTQSFKQLGMCFAFDCTLDQGIFLKSCLASAEPSVGFCAGVPVYQEKLTKDDKAWLKDSCWNKNLNGEGCRFLLKQKIYFCSQ